jgi:hypothetical protein
MIVYGGFGNTPMLDGFLFGFFIFSFCGVVSLVFMLLFVYEFTTFVFCICAMILHVICFKVSFGSFHIFLSWILIFFVRYLYGWLNLLIAHHAFLIILLHCKHSTYG